MTADTPAATPDPAPARGRGVIAYARIVLAVVVLAAVVLALVQNWGAVSGDLRKVSAGALAACVVCGLGAPWVTMLGWRAVLADLGTPLPVRPAAGIFFVGQLGKFVPGSVWTVLAQAEMGARLRIPRRRSAVAGLVSVGLSVLTGLAVGLPALPLLLRRDDTRSVLVLVLLALPALAVAIHPPVLNAMIARGLRLLRREPLEHPLSRRAVAVMSGWFLLGWTFAGASVAVLARDLKPGLGIRDLLVVAVCGFALASCAGMLVVLLPAGVGIRDGLLVLLLGTLLPVPAAAAIAVVIRFVTTIADVAYAALGWRWARARHLVGPAA
ncbi:MAG: lysylphosphatidylglycerol synthase domain-containing protein [Dermatophilaceae bacterium]